MAPQAANGCGTALGGHPLAREEEGTLLAIPVGSLDIMHKESEHQMELINKPQEHVLFSFVCIN